MKLSTITALLPFAGAAIAQGVTSIITPGYDAPASCSPTLDGQFQIIIVDLADVNKMKRDASGMYSAQGVCQQTGELIGRLTNGIFTDASNRTGYIASNFQLQFDAPPQAGAIYTGGFSHCPNGTLALGATTVFYQCRSGGFYNLYDRWWAEQCSAINILMRQCDDQGQIGPNDHSVGSVMITTTMVVPLADGQPQVITTTIADPICEIDDGKPCILPLVPMIKRAKTYSIPTGQLQGQTTPCAAIAGLAKTWTMAPASEFSDGQIQVTPAGAEPTLPTTFKTTSLALAASSFIVPSHTAPKTTPGPSASSLHPEKPQATHEPKTGEAGSSNPAKTLVVMMAVLAAVAV
ncbi:cell wall manno protein CIS3 [Rhypophila decipiens]|uniref:Cell wall manno protein CIS3 n=1 Tax=Rhypophila decipiens TaxID=261697 RepID=A0AAN7B7X4_9PEZI|nr:cell wall manno protein CIS3 [Rhypophila decipiens]